MKNLSDVVLKVRNKGLRHIVTESIPWILYDKLNTPLSNILQKYFLQKPVQDVIILESHNDFDSNGGAFYDYLINNKYNQKYKIVWFLRNKCPQSLPENVEGYRYNRLSIKRIYYHCVAKYILSEHYAIPAIREEQVAVFMRHGAGGLKKVLNYFTLPGGVHYILGLSEAYAPIEKLDSYFTNKNQKILYLGFPSHDYLFKDNHVELKKIDNRSYKKVLLWMPTFRKTVDERNDSSAVFPLGIPLIEKYDDYIKMNELLAQLNLLLIIKIHPMQELDSLKIHNMSNIKVITGNDVKKLNVDNYKLMSCCDAMISDYSGAAYDFLQLDRPMAYVLNDMNEYKIGFVVEDIHTLIAGKEIYSLGDMLDFIKDVSVDKDEFKEKREKIRDFIYTYHDNNNSKRLADFLGLD